jgi:apolipoprotein N-acyltransferase
LNPSFWPLFLGSFFLVAFGQPAWSSLAGIFSSICGYACFWKAISYFPHLKQRFWISLCWFGLVQAVQLSWMTSTHYLGPLILVVYLLLLIGLGCQFALLSISISPDKSLPFFKCLAISGGWVFLEWIRIFFMSGFTWNPVGLALSSSSYSLQFASLFGIYGLSFWVILVNLVGFNILQARTVKNTALWIFLAFLPYGFGLVQQTWVERHYKQSASFFSAALIETALTVEQKYGSEECLEDLVSPLDQWVRVWSYLKPEKSLHLIVLPEGAFPGTAYRPDYFLDEVKEEWVELFGKEALFSFPPLEEPLAFPYLQNRKIVWKVNNAFLAQALANYFHSDVIVGLNDDTSLVQRYNSAFCFHPSARFPERHLKRILAPVGEYIPLSYIPGISQFIEGNFGICDSFLSGDKATVFSSQIPIGVAICLEEIYTETVRELRQQGAQLLVGLSNDIWFPSSQLPQQHFDHSRIRAAENGVYFLRSSNMGITGGVDCFGRPLDFLSSTREGGALYLSLPIYSYPTLYSWWGDQGILWLSAIFLIFWLLRRKILPLNRSLG